MFGNHPINAVRQKKYFGQRQDRLNKHRTPPAQIRSTAHINPSNFTKFSPRINVYEQEEHLDFKHDSDDSVRPSATAILQETSCADPATPTPILISPVEQRRSSSSSNTFFPSSSNFIAAEFAERVEHAIQSNQQAQAAHLLQCNQILEAQIDAQFERTENVFQNGITILNKTVAQVVQQCGAMYEQLANNNQTTAKEIQTCFQTSLKELTDAFQKQTALTSQLISQNQQICNLFTQYQQSNIVPIFYATAKYDISLFQNEQLTTQILQKNERVQMLQKTFLGKDAKVYISVRRLFDNGTTEDFDCVFYDTTTQSFHFSDFRQER